MPYTIAFGTAQSETTHLQPKREPRTILHRKQKKAPARQANLDFLSSKLLDSSWCCAGFPSPLLRLHFRIAAIPVDGSFWGTWQAANICPVACHLSKQMWAQPSVTSTFPAIQLCTIAWSTGWRLLGRLPWEGLMLANRARVPIDTRVFNHTIPALETVSIQVWDIAWSEHSLVDQAVSSGHPKSFSALLPPVLKHAIDKIAETSAAEDCDFNYHIISYYNILQLWRPILRVYVRFWEGICCWPA